MLSLCVGLLVWKNTVNELWQGERLPHVYPFLSCQEDNESPITVPQRWARRTASSSRLSLRPHYTGLPSLPTPNPFPTLQLGLRHLCLLEGFPINKELLAWLGFCTNFLPLASLLPPRAYAQLVMIFNGRAHLMLATRVVCGACAPVA